MLRSPLDGLVSAVHKEEREFVSSNAPTVLTLVQLDPLRIIFCVPTSHGDTLKLGQQVPLAFLDTDLPATGRVEFVSPITDAESGTVRVKVLIDNPQGEFRCGVRCTLQLDGALGQQTASTH